MNDDVIRMLYERAPLQVSRTCRVGRACRLNDSTTVQLGQRVLTPDFSLFVKSFGSVKITATPFFHDVGRLRDLPDGVEVVDLSGNPTLPVTFLWHLGRSKAAASSLKVVWTDNTSLVHPAFPLNRYNVLQAVIEAQERGGGVQFPHLTQWPQHSDEFAERLYQRMNASFGSRLTWASC